MYMREGSIGHRTGTSQAPREDSGCDGGGSNCGWRSGTRGRERQRGVCDGGEQEGKGDEARDESLADIVQAWMAGSENVSNRSS